MENLTQILFYGFGAAIIGSILLGGKELTNKHLGKIKKLPLNLILAAEYFFAFLFVAILAAANGQLSFNPTTLFYAFLASLVAGLGIYLNLKAITIEDFSLTLPFLSFTFVFLIPIEFIFFKQLPTPVALLGLASIILGTFWLGYVENKERGAKWRLNKGSQLMIGAAFLFSLWGITDKAGTLSSTSLGYLVWANLFILLIYAIFNKFFKKLNGVGQNFLPVFKSNWPWFLLVGLLNGLGGWLIMNAYTRILVTYTISIKRAALLIPIILGSFIFKEKKLVQRLPGILMMLGGAIIIVLFG